jgi:hypothetical protein
MAVRIEKMDGTLHVSHQGCVIRKWVAEAKYMSDIYTNAIWIEFWNDKTCQVEKQPVIYFGVPEQNINVSDVQVDIQEDVKRYARYRTWLLSQEAEKQKREKQHQENYDLQVKNKPRHGKKMKVVKGRKVPKGTVGTVFFVRDGRVGLDVTGKKDSKGWVVDPVWVREDYLVAV